MLDGESAARGFDSRPRAGAIVLYAFSVILPGLVEAARTGTDWHGLRSTHMDYLI